MDVFPILYSLYTEHEGVYLVNDPESYDEKVNSNGKNDVDG